MVEIAQREEILSRLNRIAYDALERYNHGYSLGSAIEGACAGECLEISEIDAIESQVMAKICRETSDPIDQIKLAAPKIEYFRANGCLFLPVLDRARTATLFTEESAVLSAATHYDPLWTLVDGLAGAGKRLTVGPENRADPEVARSQIRLARQIANAPLDGRLLALLRSRTGGLNHTELTALAAATICMEIHDALNQVRATVVAARTVPRA